MANMAERAAQGIMNETLSEREKQVEGVRHAFDVVFEKYKEKYGGDLPDLTQDSVSMFIQMRPDLKRALDKCKLVNQSEWSAIALSVLEKKMFVKKHNNIEE